MKRGFRIRVLAYWGLILCPRLLLAEPIDIDKIQDQARDQYINRFTEFTKDKNVVGPAYTPGGKQVREGGKTYFDPDTGGFTPFSSDLTYHLNTYQALLRGKDPSGKDDKKVPEFVSDHGANEQDSSSLERTMWKLQEKYAKQEKDRNDAIRAGKILPPDKNPDGIEFKDVFKIETREMVDGKPAAPNPPSGGTGTTTAPDPKVDKFPVQRYTLRKEVEDEVRKTSDTATQTLLNAAKDKSGRDDAKTFGNPTLLRQGAREATEALWAATMRNLGQRRAYDTSDPSNEANKLNLGIPSCKELFAKRRQNISKASPLRQKAMEEELKKAEEECQTVTAQSYKAINPTFAFDMDDQGNVKPGPDGNSKKILKTGDFKNENQFQRDSRVQAELMAKAGKSAKDVVSNWEYSKADESFLMNQYNDKGEVVREVRMTVKDQLNNYNQQLDEAEEGYKEVKDRAGIKEVPKLSRFKIESESRSMMDINRPSQTEMEEFGISGTTPLKPAENYEELLQQGSQKQ